MEMGRRHRLINFTIPIYSYIRIADVANYEIHTSTGMTNKKSRQ